MHLPPPTSTLFPYTTLFRSPRVRGEESDDERERAPGLPRGRLTEARAVGREAAESHECEHPQRPQNDRHDPDDLPGLDISAVGVRYPGGVDLLERLVTHDPGDDS